MKVLVLALSGIGDALMFTPALRVLKSKCPAAQVDVLTMFKSCGEVFKNNPNVSNVIFFDFMNESKAKALKFVLGMRGRYDASINVYPANRAEYNGMQFMFGAKKRCAVDYLRRNNRNFAFLNNVRIREDDSLHNAQENVKMVTKLLGLPDMPESEIPAMEYFLTDEDKQFANEFVSQTCAGRMIIGFHPGCNTLKNHANRRWDASRFGELGRRLAERFDCQCLVFGGPEEKDLKDSVVAAAATDRVRSVEVRTFSQSLALMQHCNYFITNDSSLMHASAALGVYVFPIIGPTNLSYIRPWKNGFTPITMDLECAPCFFYSPKPLSCSRTDEQFKCVRALTVDFAYSVVAPQIELLSAGL